jgi:putative transposase
VVAGQWIISILRADHRFSARALSKLSPTLPVDGAMPGDNPQLVPLLDDYAAACKQHGASGRDFRLLGDKAYSHPSTRTELRSRRIKHTIPQRSDQIARRKAKGSTGGRPPAFDAALYGLRNTVERGFNRLKQWRGVATRYALTYLGAVLPAPWRRARP